MKSVRTESSKILLKIPARKITRAITRVPS